MSSLLSDYVKKGIRPVYTTGKVNGRVNVAPPAEESSSSEDEDHLNSNSYAKKYQQEELALYANCIREDVQECVPTYLDLDDTAGLAHSEIRSEVYRMYREEEVFKKYNFDCKIRKDLSIHSYKDQILNLVDQNSVIIIQGPTGCGKTTQVPQYILDHCRESNKFCKIVVTQPRKIATVTVAKRVCQDRGWALGTVCGYQVGLDKKISRDAVLTYMTTGVLLQKLIHSKNLDEFSHIIIDEIHERNQEVDFLLLVVRKLLFTKSFQTKVILMSATIDADVFAHYFRSQSKGIDQLAPIVQIDRPNQFTTKTFYLNQIIFMQLPEFDIYKPEIHEDVMKALLFLLNAFDKLDEVDPETKQVVIGSVLVFLPGIREIEDVEKLLIHQKELEKQKAARSNTSTSDNQKQKSIIQWKIIPLHSSLPSDEQAKVFEAAEPHFRKVILSTNIAESSITVPDVTYVVDFCLTKVLAVDKTSKFSSLQLEWASHVNCEQRSGRTGRVSNGRVYRMVTENFYEDMMQEKPIPEILRAPLESLVLHSKMLNFNEEPQAILALAMEPPDFSNIANTIWHLKEIGALLKTCRGMPNILDGDITFLGIVMSGLPLDVTLSKLIVLGYLFNVLEDAIIMAAGCSIQNIFSTPYNERLSAYNKKLIWADGSCSDLIALLNLYLIWRSYKREGFFNKSREEFIWCKKYQISLRGLREWQLLIDEITSRLKRYGIEETCGPQKEIPSTIEKPTILKVIICGAFYPNYFIRSAAHGQVDEREAVKTVGGRNPYRTVYFKGMDQGQPCQLYLREIKKMLELKEDAKIGFDGTAKIYVEFKTFNEPAPVSINGQMYLTTIPGNIPMDVYIALKKKQLNFKFSLDILPREKAWEHYNFLKKALKESNKEERCIRQSSYIPLPTVDTEYIEFVITHRIDTGHFWGQNVDNNTQSALHKINHSINRVPLKKVDPKSLDLNKIYVASYSVDRQNYRAQIQTFVSKDKVQILFIDYGDIEHVSVNDLYDLPQLEPIPNRTEDEKELDDFFSGEVNILEVPPLAFECILCEIKPSRVLNPKGIWSEKVNAFFDKETQRKVLFARIYSVVDGVVHLELFKQKPYRGSNPESINHWLLKNNYAEKAEESFLSKENHERRLRVQTSENPLEEAARQNIDAIKSYADFDAPMNEVKQFMAPIELKGPYSPLEMKICGALIHGPNKNVNIEPQSVNSVLLDIEPQDPHTRLIVAASVNQSASGERLILRQTTVMPSKPGFAFLMALLFCPEMKPNVNKDGTRLTSILCGVGCHPVTKKPYFPSHDMLLALDVEINEEIINIINELRFKMNLTLSSLEDAYEHSRDHIPEGGIKDALFRLLGTKLESVDPIYNGADGEWKSTPNLEGLKPAVQAEKTVWPLHWFVRLRQLEEKESSVQKNLSDLKAMAKQLMPMDVITCQLCDVELTSLSFVRKHLIDKNHKEKERKLV